MDIDRPKGEGAPDDLLPGVTLLDLEADGDHLRAGVRVAPESPLFLGHFPGRPVLPGVAIPGLVAALADRVFGDARLAGMERVKLVRPVLPGQRVDVTASRTSGGRLRFEITDASGQRVASGTLLLRQSV